MVRRPLGALWPSGHTATSPGIGAPALALDPADSSPAALFAGCFRRQTQAEAVLFGEGGHQALEGFTLGSAKVGSLVRGLDGVGVADPYYALGADDVQDSLQFGLIACQPGRELEPGRAGAGHRR